MYTWLHSLMLNSSKSSTTSNPKRLDKARAKNDSEATFLQSCHQVDRPLRAIYFFDSIDLE